MPEGLMKYGLVILGIISVTSLLMLGVMGYTGDVDPTIVTTMSNVAIGTAGAIGGALAVKDRS